MFEKIKNKTAKISLEEAVMVAFAAASLMHAAGYLYRSFKN